MGCSSCGLTPMVKRKSVRPVEAPVVKRTIVPPPPTSSTTQTKEVLNSKLATSFNSFGK